MEGTYPSAFVSPEEKASKDYILKYAKALWGEAQNNGSSTINFGNRYERYKENRKWAEGLETKYDFKQMLSSNGDDTYLNLNYNISTPLPTILRTIRGKMMNLPFKSQFEPTDSKSLTEADAKRNEMYANILIKKQMPELVENGTIKLEEPKNQPEDNEELEIYMQTEFKLGKAMAIESIVRGIKSDNRFETHIKEKLVKDLVDLKIGIYKVDLDENKNIRQRYVDPVNFIVSYCEQEDFSDARHMGELREITISDLRVQAQGQFTEEELFDIAKSVAGRNGNGDWEFGSRRYYGNNIDVTKYDSYKVRVLDFEFVSTDKMTFSVKEARNKGFFFEKKPMGYQPGRNSKRKTEVIVKDVKNIYKGKYLVDCHKVYDYGKCNHMIREKVNDKWSTNTRMSYVVIAPEIFDMENKSITESLIPYAKNLVLYQLKMQQHIAKAAPSGYKMDIDAIVGALEGMGLGNLSPLDARSIADQTGDIYYKSLRPDGTPITNTNPVERMPSGLGNEILVLGEMYNQELQRMKEAAGIVGDMNAGEPDKKALVGTQKIAISATNNAMRSLYRAMFYLETEGDTRISLLSQQLIRRKINVKLFERLAGNAAVQEIKLSDIPDAEFGITAKMLPEEPEIERVEQLIQLALQNGQISIQDVFSVRRLLKEDPESAEALLGLRVKKHMERMRKQEQENTQLQAQVQMQSSQVAEQGKQQTAQLEAQLEAQGKEIEYNLKLRNDKALEEEKRKTMALQHEYKLKIVEVSARLKAQNDSKPSSKLDAVPGTLPPGVEPDIMPGEANM